MSNIFKSNSRFSSLIDDISKQKNSSKNDEKVKSEYHSNSFKTENPPISETRHNGFRDRGRDGFRDRGRERYRLQIEEQIKTKKEFEERENERIKLESLKIENFPDLVSISKKEENKDNMTMNYMEKLNKEEIKNNDLEILKPGWVLLKRDVITGKNITISHPKTNVVENNVENNVVNLLVKLHEKRTNEYIDNYGYDEWERMFKFPDWRERETYLEEMEESEEIEESEDEDNDYEY
jgi:hypothetical protein